MQRGRATLGKRLPVSTVQWLWLALVWGCFLSVRIAHAAPPPVPRFSFGPGDCPAPSRVQSEVLRLIPRDHQSLLSDVRVEITDFGDSYSVRVLRNQAATEKTYTDSERDCQQRVRFASVFVVLTLMPPALELEPPQPDPKPTPPPAAPPKAPAAPAPSTPPLARIELSGVLDYSPTLGKAPRITSYGGELRVILGRGNLAATLGVGYAPRATFQLQDLSAEITRLPASAGIRLRTPIAPFELLSDLGLAATLERLAGTNAAFRGQRSIVELGVRAGVAVSLPIGPNFALFAGAHALLVPFARDIVTVPAGVLGHTPNVWVGGTVGLAVAF